MVNVARFSRARVLLNALGFLFFAAVVGMVTGALYFHEKPFDVSAGIASVIGLFVMLVLLCKALSLIKQGFKRGCYLRSGPEGIELRLGVSGPYSFITRLMPRIEKIAASPDSFYHRFPGAWSEWDGSSYVYRFKWSQITAIDVTIAHSMTIDFGGPAICIARYYFSETSAKIAEALLSHRPRVVREEII